MTTLGKPTRPDSRVRFGMRSAPPVPERHLTVFGLYHLSRLIFGGWWLFSGVMYFAWPELQQLGEDPAAIAFTQALMDSGLFEIVKAMEILLGLTILANRAMPLTIIALVPINLVIVYWSFVLDTGLVEWTFGALTIVFNAILAWPWRHSFWPLFVWRGRADFATEPGAQDYRL